MFPHRSKFLMHRMPLALAMLLLFVSLISAADETKASTTDTNDDYGHEEEDTTSPGEQHTTGPKPYFEEATRVLRVKPKNKTHIDCPVKGFNDASHAVSWYKNDVLITIGNHTLLNSTEYQVDGNLNLVIGHFTNTTPGNFTCQIDPGKIRQTTLLEVANGANKHFKNMSIFLAAIAYVLAKGLSA